MIDERLYDFATETEARHLDAIKEHGSGKAAERALGLGNDTISKALRRLKKRAAEAGCAPEAGLDHPVAEGFKLKGYSHLTKTAAGENIWLKAEALRERYAAAIIEAIQATPYKVINIPPPKLTGFDARDIIPWLEIGDAHIGMLAHESETGANFDISIASAEITQAAFDLIDLAPDCERLVVNDLGDGTHYENFKALTEASGHAVDFDTRFPKMIRAYYDIMEAIIEKAMTKAQTVDVIVNQGNHSRTNDIHAAEHFRRHYARTGRVNVLPNESPFIGYRMGKTFVLVHHGDKCKPEKLRGVMSNDFAIDWGEATFRYIDGGHVHHFSAKELEGAQWESFNNLAPMDKYAHDGGWRSKQAMTLVLRSRLYGDVGRHKMPVEKVWDRIRETAPEHYVPRPKRAFQA